MHRDGRGRRTLDCYRDAPAPVRAHVRLRWLTCPFPALAREVPAEGRVLDVGCGHGLLTLHLALGSPARTVLGADVDGDKLTVAAAAGRRAAAAGARVAFRAVPPGDLPSGPWDAVAVVDVLYLLPPAAQRALVVSCAASLAPGGVLLVKETATRPRWKRAVTVAQELVSVRALQLTQGEEVRFADPAAIETWMRDAGLSTARRPLDRGYPYAHLALVGLRA